MITTICLKRDQLRDGFFQSGNGPEKILLVGSCRVIGYLNYLIRANDGRYTIRCLDPFNWHWNERDEFIDFEAKINSLQSHEGIRAMLADTSIYIHEYYESFGMFNSTREAAKNIYQFGLNPSMDICIPNFHDRFILRNDFAAFGPVPEDWIERGNAAVDRFCELCALSSFPEMAEYFRSNWKTTRFFWTSNHITSDFALYIFRRMNEKFLRLPLGEAFWSAARTEDMFREPHTHTTPQDTAAYGLSWSN